MTHKIESIQGLRTLLFIGILFFHSGISLFSACWGGVNVFLTLTSFLLTGTLLKKNNTELKIGKLIKRRLIRIYPAYILVVFFCITVYILRNHSIPSDFIPLILTSQNFWWVYDAHPTPMTGHLWYITLDIYLSIVWIIMLRFIPREKLVIFFYGCILIAILWRTGCVFLNVLPLCSYIIPIGMIDSFALGGLIAIGCFDRQPIKKVSPYICIALGLTGFVLCLLISARENGISLLEAYFSFSSSKGYASNPITINVFLFISLIGVGLILLCKGSPNHKLLSSKYMVEIGGMTYLLYLVHYPTLIMLRPLISHHVINNSGVIAVGTLVISMIAAYVYHKFLAAPVDRMMKPFTDK